MRPYALALAGLLAVLAAPPARAVRSSGDPPEAVAARGAGLHPERQAILERGPAWQAFRVRHGDWRALWNEAAGTPHRAAGPAIRLPGSPQDGPAIDRALRGFVSGNPDLFGRAAAGDLELLRASRRGRIWYLSYRRRAQGVPVLFEDWEFRVGSSGRLMAFGADAPALPPALDAAPRLSAAAAREAARAALGLGAGAEVQGGETLYWLPEPGPGAAWHLVRDVRARATLPPASWIALVDAADGTLRLKLDRIRYDVAGAITGTTHDDLPTGVPVLHGMPHERVVVGGNVVFADAAGIYSSPATGTVTVTSALEGRFCEVFRFDGPDAAFSTSVTDPDLAHVAWDDVTSNVAERDGYYHVTLIHDHVAALDPAFTGNDYPMPCSVNIDAFCNAFWDGVGVNFFRAGEGCANTASMPDVVYHEYGHGVNDNLYIQAGAPFGMSNGALHEGLADVTAAFLQDDPFVGNGFFGPGTILRSVSNTARWPADASADPHVTGLIVAGAMWDLRQSIGLPAAEALSHFAKYGRPDDFQDDVAMGEYFTEVLVADDDDADLGNGTPHGGAIVAAFNAHGIGTGLFLQVVHAPLADQPGPGPFEVVATVATASPIGGLDPASFVVRYSVSGSPFGSVPLLPDGGGDYHALVPAPTGSIVRYWLSVADQFGATQTLPGDPNAPLVFLAGATTTFLVNDHESNNGWTPADISDNATAGRWQWVEPMGSLLNGQQVQPEDDHSPFGILCYVTQNPFMDFSPGAHDVDNGHTTLYTNTIDATSAGPDPMIEYYRWYTNELGNNPRSDVWRVEISNDGGFAWVPVESTTEGHNEWRRVVFFVKDYVAPTSFVLMRFIAEDVGGASLVEAAVDDLRLLSFDAGITGVAEEGGASLGLGPPRPNPSSGATRLAFTTARRGAVSLAIFDLAGRRVRALHEGVLEPGRHEALWDGRDESGHRVSSGLYFARLEAAGQVLTRRVARAR